MRCNVMDRNKQKYVYTNWCMELLYYMYNTTLISYVLYDKYLRIALYIPSTEEKKYSAYATTSNSFLNFVAILILTKIIAIV